MAALPSIPFPAVEDATARCRSEFLEMPGMCLTLPQAARFLGIDRVTCEQALEDLVSSGFRRKAGTAYKRIGIGRD